MRSTLAAHKKKHAGATVAGATRPFAQLPKRLWARRVAHANVADGCRLRDANAQEHGMAFCESIGNMGFWPMMTMVLPATTTTLGFIDTHKSCGNATPTAGGGGNAADFGDDRLGQAHHPQHH